MNFYKTYTLKKRDIRVQCSIAIPKQVVEYLGFKAGDELRLRVKKGAIAIRKVRAQT